MGAGGGQVLTGGTQQVVRVPTGFCLQDPPTHVAKLNFTSWCPELTGKLPTF